MASLLRYICGCAALLVFFNQCNRDITYPSIEQNVASPVDMVYHQGTQTYVVLNSNLNHTYKTGSLLLLTRSGDKIAAFETPRLGRSMKVAGDYLLVTFENDSVTEERKALTAQANLYKISKDTLTLVKDWKIPDCDPLGLDFQEGYPYFAISCTNGKLHLGKLNDTAPESSTLDYIRQFPGSYMRRALHLRPERGLLLAFVTDAGEPNLFDSELEDTKSWDDSGKPLPDNENDIPDSYNAPGRWQDFKKRGSPYTVFIYDIAKAEAERDANGKLPFKDYKDTWKDEYRFVYFQLENKDGTPDGALADAPIQVPNNKKKFYRTNFGDIIPDTDGDSFYITHRSRPDIKSKQIISSVVKVSFVDEDYRPNPETQTVPLTKSYLQFKRVYGFKDQLPDYNYAVNLRMTHFLGTKTLLINHYRNPIDFTDKHPYYAIHAFSPDAPLLGSSLFSSLEGESYYGLASSGENDFLTCSFFSNQVILGELTPEGQIEIKKTIGS